MKKLLKQLTIFAIIAGVALVAADVAMADGPNLGLGSESDAGNDLLTDIAGSFNSGAGKTVGLLISLFGLYMWIWNQVSWGILVAIAGGLLTAFPNIYSNLTEGAQNVFSNTVDGS